MPFCQGHNRPSTEPPNSRTKNARSSPGIVRSGALHIILVALLGFDLSVQIITRSLRTPKGFHNKHELEIVEMAVDAELSWAIGVGEAAIC